jgi:hypothetical protein
MGGGDTPRAQWENGMYIGEQLGGGPSWLASIWSSYGWFTVSTAIGPESDVQRFSGKGFLGSGFDHDVFCPRR